MFFGKPFNEKIKTAYAVLRADARAPTGSVFHQFAKTDQADDFIVGRVFQQTARRPILIQPSFFEAAFKDFHKLALVKVIVPNIRKP